MTTSHPLTVVEANNDVPTTIGEQVGESETAVSDAVAGAIDPWWKCTNVCLLRGMVLMLIVASIAIAAAILIKNKTNPPPIPSSKPLLSSETTTPDSILSFVARTYGGTSRPNLHKEANSPTKKLRTMNDGDQTISIDCDGSPLTITTTSRVAGAVDSIRWRNYEFIDSTDHGRQLQSACSFDAMSDEPFWAERYNPTEAGSRLDGAGNLSTSRLLAIQRDDRELRTSTQMAFWLAPGEESFGHSALNTQVLSDHILDKRIRLGAYDDPHVIQIDNTFNINLKERNRYAQFEVLTGYMPEEFSEFWRVSTASRELHRLDDGPGEQPDPVILSTRDGQFAMGAISPGVEVGYVGYGRFRFSTEKVVKWNVVHRYNEIPFITKSKASFRVLVAVGTLEQVHAVIRRAIDGELVPLVRVMAVTSPPKKKPTKAPSKKPVITKKPACKGYGSSGCTKKPVTSPPKKKPTKAPSKKPVITKKPVRL